MGVGSPRCHLHQQNGWRKAIYLFKHKLYKVMIISLLRKILTMSRYVFYGLILQCTTATVLLSYSGTLAQRKSLNEIYVSIKVENEKITDVFKEIEKNTGFNFTYNNKNIDKTQRITLAASNKTLASVLEDISGQARLTFKRINENIHVAKQAENENVPSVAEVISEIVARAVTGKVTSEDGEGLPGVNILVKGTSIGTTSDVSGNYSIDVPDDNAVLVFSFIGYVTQEVPVGSQSVIDVQLKQDVVSLEEIVVVGYGSQEKKAITSAIANVTPDEFNKGNVNNVAQLLQGKVAGLQISRAGGDPNQNFSIRLRGLSTLGANTQPLVVIDGQIGADLNSVDPNDIKSIDVLKDGSAAAIYGTRGSAGVIIITTKSGGKEGTTIDYNGYVTAETPVNFTKHMTAAEFVAAGGTDHGANTDWNKEITRTAITQVHNISLAGGTSSGTGFRAAINYRAPQGVAINTGFERINARMNLSQVALNNKLNLNFNVSTMKQDSKLGFSDAFKYATIFNPTSPVRTTDPTFDLAGGGYFEENFVDYANPVAALKQNVNNQTVKRLNMIASAEYEIVKGLHYLVRYSQQSDNTYSELYLPRNAWYTPTLPDNIGRSKSGFSSKGYARKFNDERFNQLFETTLTYDTRVAESFNVTALAGYSYQDFTNKGFGVQGGGFLTDVGHESIGSISDFSAGTGRITSYKNGSRLVAFFGRLNVNYNDIAFFQASLRREGSTQFGANNKWGMFPSVSAGVDLTRLVTIPSADNLKLRASYGVTGSLPPQSYLSSITLSAQNSTSSFYLGNDSWTTVFGPSRNPNPDLKWETKAEFDIGLDLSFFNGRLSGSIDYYDRTTSDLIYQIIVPVPPNYTRQTWKNVGTMKSNGIEIALGYDVLKKSDFSWNTSVNFTTYDVKLTELLNNAAIPPANLGTPGQEATQIARVILDESIGALWGYVYDGIDEDGKYVFKDVSGNGTIGTEDQTVVGNGLPKFEFGWTNTFTYKRFDFNFFLRGAIGHDLVNTYRGFYENPTVVGFYNVVKTKYYNPEVNDIQTFSSLFVEDASFVKLDNATIGYTIPLPNKNVFRNVRLYLSGQNLFKITGYTGVDPEVRFSDIGNTVLNNTGTNSPNNNANLTPGIDRRETWVWTRSFTFGVNLGL